MESQVYKTCLSIRMPRLTDKKKQQLLEETEALRDRNDWILDRKHVYGRSILKKKMPQWMESVERMEAHYRPIWDPPALSREWKPPVSEQDLWAFPKRLFTDGEQIANEFLEFMKDPKNVAQNLRWKNNLSALGLDGIAYLMLKLGEAPQLDFLSHIFEACVNLVGCRELGKGHEQCSYTGKETLHRRKIGDRSESRHACIGSLPV
jgi:hypothetical protein